MQTKRAGYAGLAIVVMAALLLAGCGGSVNGAATLRLVEEMNADSNFGAYRMLQPAPTHTGDEFDPGNPDMFYEYDAAGEIALEGMYWGYPGAEDERLLTKLFLCTDEFRLYDFSVGSATEDAMQSLLARGYTESDSKTDDLWYTQADIIISLRVNKESISRISINIMGAETEESSEGYWSA